VIAVAVQQPADARRATAAPVAADAPVPGGAKPPARPALLDYLAQVPLFADLDAETLQGIATHLRRRAFAAGEVIFHRGDPGLVLYIIRQGKVKIALTSPDGQELSLALLCPGECFGELALLDGQPRSADATALEAVDAYWLRRSDFIGAVMHHPQIAVQVMQVLARRLRQTDEMVQDLLFLDVHGRVAKKLIELTETHGTRTPEGVRIEMRLTQADLAALVGASRESVNKVMGYLTEKGYISTDRHRTTVTRLTELRRRIC
jgi:CRP/FNR family transcriptional regulator/CRP/FNR family cyclic AMP-dependent transcriptional regulator